MRMATSPDGITWTYVAVVVDFSAGGGWDDEILDYASIFWNLGVWYLFYSGGSTSSWTSQRIGLVTSPDGKNFTRFYVEAGKQFDVGAGGQWDANTVNAPAMLMINDIFYLYYTGSDGTKGQIGLATLPVAG